MRSFFRLETIRLYEHTSGCPGLRRGFESTVTAKAVLCGMALFNVHSALVTLGSGPLLARGGLAEAARSSCPTACPIEVDIGRSTCLTLCFAFLPRHFDYIPAHGRGHQCASLAARLTVQTTVRQPSSQMSLPSLHVCFLPYLELHVHAARSRLDCSRVHCTISTCT